MTASTSDGWKPILMNHWPQKTWMQSQWLVVTIPEGTCRVGVGGLIRNRDAAARRDRAGGFWNDFELYETTPLSIYFNL